MYISFTRGVYIRAASESWCEHAASEIKNLHAENKKDQAKNLILNGLFLKAWSIPGEPKTIFNNNEFFNFL
jgi:hypothetical protein